MGYSTDYRGRLCCDSCGRAGGVRRRRCPVNYCPAWAACAACWNDPEKRAAWTQHHVDADCKGSHERYEAQRARVAELQAAGEYVFCASVNESPAGERRTAVRCWFRGVNGDTKEKVVAGSVRDTFTPTTTYDEVARAMMAESLNRGYEQEAARDMVNEMLDGAVA